MHQQPRRSSPLGRSVGAARVEAGEGAARPVPRSWVREDHRIEADRVDRLLADAELVTRLQLARFEGPDWKKFATELARYGMAVLGSWMYTRTIFARLRARGVGVPPLPDTGWDYDTRAEIAGLTVAIALRKFRETVLIPNTWDPNRGATLRTFFIGQCLIRFPNVYREWLTESHRWQQLHDQPDEDTWPHTMASSNVEREVVGDAGLEELLDEAPDQRTRHLLLRLAEGSSQREIADELDCTVKAVERLLYRHRKRHEREERREQAS